MSEAARAGDALVTLQATAGVNAPAPRLLYGLAAARAPRDLALFRLHELTGVLELARPLDRFVLINVYFSLFYGIQGIFFFNL